VGDSKSWAYNVAVREVIVNAEVLIGSPILVGIGEEMAVAVWLGKAVTGGVERTASVLRGFVVRLWGG
jgi:hypothetical protein